MATLGVLDVLIRTKDETSKGIDSAEKNVKSYGNRLSAWTIAKGQMLANFAQKAVTTTYNISKGLVKSAVSAYGQYEQLEGGIKKLFGENVQKTVIKNAQTAFHRAGLSANEYMQTVTEFSASLISGLSGDTERAADVADMAIQDMADNVNTFGSSMESVQNAYRGFSKQNYTMLDNLKLGYGGTRKEMERLLEDAGKLTGKKYSIQSLADVYEAIHEIQENMNITGTTKKEASTTIEGTIASAKAAWQNVLTSLGSGQNVKWSVRSFTYTLKKVFTNVKPVVIDAVKGLFTGIKELLPEIGDIISSVIDEMKNSDSPILQKLGAALEWVKGLADIVVTAFTEGIPKAIEKLRAMDAPLTNIAADGLETLYRICSFFVNNVGIENTIKIAIGAFVGLKGLSVSNSVLTFLTKLSVFKNGFPSMPDYSTKIPTDTAPGTDAGSDATTAAAGGSWLSKIKAGGKALIAGTSKLALTAGVALAPAWIAAAASKLIPEEAKINSTERVKSATYTKEDVANLREWVDLQEEQKKLEDQYGTEGFDEERYNEIADRLEEIGDIQKNELGEKFWDYIVSNPDDVDRQKVVTELEEAIGDVEYKTKPLVNDNAAMFISDQIGQVPVEVVPVVGGDGSLGLTMGGTPKGGGGWSPAMYIKEYAKGIRNVSYDHYALLHRGEEVLTASQARKEREGGTDNTGIISALQSLRNDLSNLQLVVGRKTFGRAVVNYGGGRMSDYIGGSESRLAAGYGT